jgi:hypothetical protein
MLIARRDLNRRASVALREMVVLYARETKQTIDPNSLAD